MTNLPKLLLIPAIFGIVIFGALSIYTKEPLLNIIGISSAFLLIGLGYFIRYFSENQNRIKKVSKALPAILIIFIVLQLIVLIGKLAK